MGTGSRSLDLVVRLVGDTKKLDDSLSKTGKTLSKTLTPAAAAAGLALRSIEDAWGGAEDAIVVGTGATGKALDDLMASAKRVGGRVSNDFEQVGVAIAEVSTRTGATGDALEDLSKQMLDLSRITKTEVKQNVADVTRVFGDWSIAAENQSLALDQLFRMSQLTGIGVDQLSQTVVQFGAPMRQLGFTFEESIALLGKWEKEGVNVETVLAGLRFGLKSFAKAGEEPSAAMQRAIADIKAAGTAAKANAIAFEIFGVRAGPDMAAAIREGRFELGPLLAELESSEGALDDAANATSGLNEWLGRMRNQATIALGPMSEIGMAVAGIGVAVGPAMQGLGKLKGMLSTTSATGVTSMSKLGGALGVAGVAGAIFIAASALDSFINNSKSATEVVEGLSRAVGDEVIPQFEKEYKWFLTLGNAAEAYEQVAQENLGTAIRLRDAYAAQGKDVAELTKAIDDETEAQKQANKDMAAGTSATEEAAAAAQEAAEKQRQLEEQTERNAAAMDAWASSARRAADAMSAAWAAEGRAADLDDAFAGLNAALAGTADAGEKAGKTVDLVAKKQEKLDDATKDAVSAQEALAKAFESTEDAAEAVTKAQAELEELLEGPSAQDRTEAEWDASDARTAAEDAADALAKAEQELAEARGAGDADEIRRKENDLEQARVRAERAAAKAKEAEDALNGVKSWTAENDPKVADAQDKLTEARDRHNKATEDAKKKYQELLDAQAAQQAVQDASLASFGEAGGALDTTRSKADELAKAYTRVRDSIREIILASLQSEAAGATKREDLQALYQRVASAGGLTDEQRAALLAQIAEGIIAARGAKSSGKPGLPGYDGGGVVPGPVGRPQVAVVHGGEEVLTPEQRRERRRSSSGSSGGGNTYMFPNFVGDTSALVREIEWAERRRRAGVVTAGV
jgi:hypothetical protein